MKNYKNLINEVSQKTLCCYCGTCVGVCPVSAIELSFGNLIETNKCNDCGLCYKCCPGKGFDFQYFNNLIFKKKFEELDNEIGSYKKIYSGFSSNKLIREKSSSGGIVTSILIGAIEENIIDAAIVVGSNDDNAFTSDVMISKDKKNIINACQSKYTIISNNKIINHLKDTDDRYAFVGLPCQIHGLRHAEENINWLKKKIKLHIGLFCGFNLYPAATDFLLKKLKINHSDIRSLEYRGGNNPNGFRVTLKDNNEFFIEKHAYSFLNMIFTPKRCWKCYDLTAEFSDISVGDAWEKIGKGWSRIITRTATGEKIIRILSEKKYIVIEESNKKEIINTQNHLVMYKKKWFWIRFKVFKNKPDYNVYIKPYMNFPDKIKGFLFYLAQLTFSNLGFKKIILPLLPLGLLLRMSKLIRNRLILK